MTQRSTSANVKLALQLKKTLDSKVYLAFKKLSKDFVTTKEASVHAYVSSAVALLSQRIAPEIATQLLIDAVALLPDPQKRSQVLRLLKSQTPTQPTQQVMSSAIRRSATRERQMPAMSAICLCPGIVVLRHCLNERTQQLFADMCLAKSSQQSQARRSFYKTNTSGLLKLNMGKRGRTINPLSAYPAMFATECYQLLEKARAVDPSLPPMNADTLLTNFYQPDATFKWHQDSEDPHLIKSGQGKPIVSCTVGLSCQFGMKTRYDDEEHRTVQLDSGDTIVFGGPSRMVVHSVLKVIRGTMPPYLKGLVRKGRLNLTFRDVGDGVIDVSEFPRYRVSYS